jgi:hypothetical protein
MWHYLQRNLLKNDFTNSIKKVKKTCQLNSSRGSIVIKSIVIIGIVIVTLSLCRSASVAITCVFRNDPSLI